MIRLGKVCHTCKHAKFKPGYNTSVCKYWTSRWLWKGCIGGHSTIVSKVFTCDNWEKGESTLRPKRRFQYWLDQIEQINSYIRNNP